MLLGIVQEMFGKSQIAGTIRGFKREAQAEQTAAFICRKQVKNLLRAVSLDGLALTPVQSRLEECRSTAVGFPIASGVTLRLAEQIAAHGAVKREVRGCDLRDETEVLHGCQQFRRLRGGSPQRAQQVEIEAVRDRAEAEGFRQFRAKMPQQFFKNLVGVGSLRLGRLACGGIALSHRGQLPSGQPTGHS